MKRISCVTLALISVFSVCSTVLAQDWGTLAFRDDFNGPVGEMPDANNWIVNRIHWWSTLGRTFFPSPVYHPNETFPYLDGNGICIIEHHHYNPRDLGTPKTTFLGGEIHTKRVFAPITPYRIEARVKCKKYPNGLVSSFFLYGYRCGNSDEIDDEFVSKKTNDDINYPDGDPIMTNPWNESNQCPEYIAPNDLNLMDWNIFRIYWYPDQNVQWSWIHPVDGEVFLRTESSQICVADEPMHAYFNFWAPTQDWPDAYDANLQPAQEPNDNQIFKYEIDYVEVRVPEPICGDLNHPYIAGDLDWDCDVDTSDCNIFCDEWLGQGCKGGDLNENEHVDFQDFAVLALHWLESNVPAPTTCFPSNHPDYPNWVTVGQPSCWCCGTQCHGDRNCDGIVDDKDIPPIIIMGSIFPNPTYDPCFDFDHDLSIWVVDLTIVKAYQGLVPPSDCLTIP